MRRYLLLSSFLSLFLIAQALAFLPWNRAIPAVRLSEKGQVIVYWETTNPTAKATVYYAAEDGSYHQPFPHYYARAAEPSVGKSHSIVLSDIEPNVLYNYRVSCFDTENQVELRSVNCTFRIVERAGKRTLGLVLTEGPIVANVTTSTVTIAWKTNLPTRGRVWYWTDSANKAQKVTAQRTDTKFELTLEKLKKDKVYSYRVVSFSPGSSDSAASRTYAFRTAPDIRATGKFSFAVYGDSRGGREADVDYHINGVNYVIVNKLTHAAWRKGARLFLQTGDLADGDTPDREDMKLQYETHKKAIAAVNAHIPIYHAVGNHDASGPHIKFGKRGKYDPPSPNSAENLWAETFVLPTNGPEPEPGHPPFKENVYSFDYGNAHFVALNSRYFPVVQDDSAKYEHAGFAYRIAGRQLAWLIDDLKEAGNKPKFVYFHDPAYPAGGHQGSSLDKFPLERDSLWTILDKNNVTLVFAGHEHIYARVKVDSTINPAYGKSIYQIITGGGGAPTYAQDTTISYLKNVLVFKRTYNLVLVTVDGRHVKVEAFDDNENKIDEFEIDA